MNQALKIPRQATAKMKYCLMADDSEEVFDFSNPEFTRENLVTALNEMVLEYKKLSQSFTEFKAEEESCATSAELVGSGSMHAALSKLKNENADLKNRSEELLCENHRLIEIINSWMKSSVSFKKLQGVTKQFGDKIGLGYSSYESSTSETGSNPRQGETKFKTINFLKFRREQIAEENSVRADLGTTTKLHVKKFLTSKQVQNYPKGNQGTTPTEETARNTAGGTSQQVPPEVPQFLADDTEQDMPNPRKRKHKVEATMTQPKQTAIPDITAHIPVEKRGIVVSTNDDPEEESETYSCPLVPRQRRETQVSESSDSLPLTHLLKRLRTQRPDHTILPDPIPARTTAPAKSLQVGNIDNLTEKLDLNDQTIPTEGEGFKDGASVFIDTILTASNTNEENIADNEQFAHGSEEPETIAPTLAAQIHSASASADQYCQSLIASAREKLLEWAETEDITELSERRSLILYKLLETELEQLYLAHLANFKTCVASAHYDFECIRLLHQELRLIAAGHRHHRGLAGSALDAYQHENQTAAHAAHERQAQETELQIQIPDHDTHGHDGQSSEDGVDPKINAIPISAINSEDIPNQSYARLCDDSLITRHHTTKLRNKLKSTEEGFDIKIDVLERTLTQLLIDELAVVKSQLACLVEDLKEKESIKEIIHTKVSRTGQNLSRSTNKSARSIEVKVKPA
ncbi:putative pre-mRNA-splicing factor ATP-dependent RNA helicase-like [Dorcoceras hygrometricum]|uniref:Putative pre-mRNA-splicing factor ATP-dependent RNA helicase-like n=1 Tax=Dorcoceras hygrometricum TaxID=472368 RepID=A0A2Z7BX01_9LAMI|nr:putative pre-mRNA-splicing factor ATP-dependent RNA helicase-like [Dorcoceras hygrometricum]